jgi:hypothetical protein
LVQQEEPLYRPPAAESGLPSGSGEISFKPPQYCDSKQANDRTNHHRGSFHIDPRDYILPRIVLYFHSFTAITLGILNSATPPAPEMEPTKQPYDVQKD